MADRKYYVICDNGCKFESLTKEQILTAITQAINDGNVGNVDTGFITTLKTINGKPLKFFVGTQAEYELLTDSDKKDLFAMITNDATKDALLGAIELLNIEIDNLAQGLSSGEIVPKCVTDLETELRREISTVTVGSAASVVEELKRGDITVQYANYAYQADIADNATNATTANTAYRVNCIEPYITYDRRIITESGTYEFRVNRDGKIYCGILSIVWNDGLAYNSRTLIYCDFANNRTIEITYDGYIHITQREYSEMLGIEERDLLDSDANITVEYRKIL